MRLNNIRRIVNCCVISIVTSVFVLCGTISAEIIMATCEGKPENLGQIAGFMPVVISIENSEKFIIFASFKDIKDKDPKNILDAVSDKIVLNEVRYFEGDNNTIEKLKTTLAGGEWFWIRLSSFLKNDKLPNSALFSMSSQVIDERIGMVEFFDKDPKNSQLNFVSEVMRIRISK